MASTAPTIEEAICLEFGLHYNIDEGLYTLAAEYGHSAGARVEVVIGDDWVVLDAAAGLRTAAIQKIMNANGRPNFVLIQMNLMPAEPALSILKELSLALANIKIEAAPGGRQPETSLEKWLPLVEVYNKTKKFLEDRT